MAMRISEAQGDSIPRPDKVIGNGKSAAKARDMLGEVLLQSKLSQLSPEIIDVFTDIGEPRHLYKRSHKDYVEEPDSLDQSVNAMAGKLYQGYMNSLADVDAFGDTYERSRQYLKDHPDASVADMKAAAQDLGDGIFIDLAGQLARFHAKGRIADEKVSQEAWELAFGVSRKYIPPLFLEVVPGEIETQQGMVTVPKISRVVGVSPTGDLRIVDQYRAIVRHARDIAGSYFTDQVNITIIVPPNSSLAREDDEVLAKRLVQIEELPIPIRMKTDLGFQMLGEDLFASDSALPSEEDTFISWAEDRFGPSRRGRALLERARAAAREMNADALPPDLATSYDGSHWDGTEPLSVRLLAAYPQDLPNDLEE